MVARRQGLREGRRRMEQGAPVGPWHTRLELWPLSAPCKSQPTGRPSRPSPSSTSSTTCGTRSGSATPCRSRMNIAISSSPPAITPTKISAIRPSEPEPSLRKKPKPSTAPFCLLPTAPSMRSSSQPLTIAAAESGMAASCVAASTKARASRKVRARDGSRDVATSRQRFQESVRFTFLVGPWGLSNDYERSPNTGVRIFVGFGMAQHI